MNPVDRYARQVVLPEIGVSGQEKLARASVLVVGCGALGSAQLQCLARAGVGHIRLIDRDLVEEHNLQRQILYDEEDLVDPQPKAELAAGKLRRINSTIRIEGIVADLSGRNVEKFLAGVDLVLDGTDNFETRYLLNDACVKHRIPWIYGGVLGTTGMSLTVRPHLGPCLRCLFPEAPPLGSLPTCETAGVLNTAPIWVAAHQVTEALRLLIGSAPPSPKLRLFDLWQGSLREVAVERAADCTCCGQHRYEALEARAVSQTTVLCGRDTVQISPPQEMTIALDELARRCSAVGKVSFHGLFLQVEIGLHILWVFPDGRVLVKGTTDEAVARTLVAKYLGM